jgi:hypothetical protein
MSSLRIGTGVLGVLWLAGACSAERRSAALDGTGGVPGHGAGGVGAAPSGGDGVCAPAAATPPGGSPVGLIPPIDLPPGTICAGDRWCWYNPLPTGTLRITASGTSDDNVWIGGDGDEVFHFDGRSWRVFDTDIVETERLWSFSPTDVWAVGVFGGAHYDGVTFSRVPELDAGATDVWGSSPSDVYVTGGPAVLHFDGYAWSELPGVAARHVAGSGPHDVWFADFRSVSHFDGTTVSRAPELEGLLVLDLAVAARDDVWVVTLNTDGSATELIWHFDGITWAIVHENDDVPGAFVWTLSASAPDDVWVVGASFRNEGFALRWDGTAFRREPGLPGLFAVERIGGGHFALGLEGEVLHRRLGEAAWRALSPGPRVALKGTWGSAPTNMWAVGEAGTIVHYDGRGVAQVPSGVSTTLNDVGGAGAANVWAVGAAGVALRLVGCSWAPLATGTTAELHAVFAADAGEAWFGGDGATLLRVAGADVTPAGVPGLPPESAIRDIHGVAADDIWLVASRFASGGAPTTFLSHFDGATWSAAQPLDIQSGNFEWRLWALAPDDVWLSLGFVLIDTGMPRPTQGQEYWRFDGLTWNQRLVPLPIPDEIWMFGDGNPQGARGATFSFGPSDVWSVGETGRWLRQH